MPPHQSVGWKNIGEEPPCLADARLRGTEKQEACVRSVAEPVNAPLAEVLELRPQLWVMLPSVEALIEDCCQGGGTGSNNG